MRKKLLQSDAFKKTRGMFVVAVVVVVMAKLLQLLLLLQLQSG